MTREREYRMRSITQKPMSRDVEITCRSRQTRDPMRLPISPTPPPHFRERPSRDWLARRANRHARSRRQLFFVVFASCVVEEQSSIRKGLPRRAVEEIRNSNAKQSVMYDVA